MNAGKGDIAGCGQGSSTSPVLGGEPFRLGMARWASSGSRATAVGAVTADAPANDGSLRFSKESRRYFVAGPQSIYRGLNDENGRTVRSP